MPSFPSIYGGRMALYPLTRGVSTDTKVVEFRNRARQKWRRRKATDKWRLELEGINPTDRNAIWSFWDLNKGRFATFDITIGGTNYPRMSFASDSLQETENVATVYTMVIELEQCVG